MSQTLSARRRMLAVLAGGFLGTLTRYELGTLLQGWFGKAWPYDLLLINLTGALALAFVTTLADETFLVGPTRRLLFNTGFLGAYTTFSSLALGDVLLLRNGAWAGALIYLILSFGGGIGAVLCGDWLGQKCIQRFRQPVRAFAGQAEQRLSRPHLDVQDDLLLPEETGEFETRFPS